MIKIISLIQRDFTSNTLKQYCERAQITWIEAQNTDELFVLVTAHQPEIVLVSLSLTGYESEYIVTELRNTAFKTKVLLFLTQYSVSERMKQFKQGADDIMALPYHPRECFLRIQRLLKFQRVFNATEYLLNADITYHATNSVLQLQDRNISIRRREGQVLACLAEHKNIVVSRQQIATWVWGDASLASLSTVDVYVKRLREILGDHASIIKTVRGLGYQLELPNVSCN